MDACIRNSSLQKATFQQLQVWCWYSWWTFTRASICMHTTKLAAHWNQEKLAPKMNYFRFILWTFLIIFHLWMGSLLLAFLPQVWGKFIIIWMNLYDHLIDFNIIQSKCHEMSFFFLFVSNQQNCCLSTKFIGSCYKWRYSEYRFEYQNQPRKRCNLCQMDVIGVCKSLSTQQLPIVIMFAFITFVLINQSILN